ncbi:MAG TPA: N-acetylmuramoyl-L-alanine amidase [Acidobacteriaceae bacterium]|jgi:N-acetylmuramoyl-L-alanine amidase|nr:N-acetylmuramoyl-L-alanine amidase [Acidobacteriaceae bacterium]
MRWIEAGAALGLLAGIGQAPGPLQHPPQAPPPVLPAPVQPPLQPRYVVVLDAAHGGADSGAKLGAGVLEKDITLGLAGRLRSMLRARGIDVVLTRQADMAMAPLDRAQTANHAQAAACLVLHATATGSGVHLFTSSLAPAARMQFLPWQTAQAAYVTQSLKLESEIDTALAHAQIQVTLARASVEPMDSLACPEVAVEVAPLVAGQVSAGKPITDGGYQTSVVDAIVAALEAWRSDWKAS